MSESRLLRKNKTHEWRDKFLHANKLLHGFVCPTLYMYIVHLSEEKQRGVKLIILSSCLRCKETT